jgi:hypothetical protein
MLVRRFSLVFLLMAALVGSAGTAFSQDVSGSFDGYYEFNLNRPSTNSNALRAFDINHNSISLNYAEVVIEKKPAKIGYRFDLGIGDTARIVNSTERSITGNTHFDYLQQAYLSGKVSDRLQVDFGKFVTPMGAEVIETQDNWNYSRSLLFTWAVPLYHTGLRATMAENDQFTIAAFLVNGWDVVTDGNSAKTVGLSATWKPKDTKLTWVGNWMGGEEQQTNGPVRHTFDTTLSYDYKPRVSFMANYDYGRDGAPGFTGKVHWEGVAVYSKLQADKKLTILPRYELFRDRDGFRTGARQTLQEVTVTGQVPLEGDKAILWIEGRRDWNKGFPGKADPAVFPIPAPGLGVNRPSAKNFQTTFTVGVTYAFKK